MSDPKPEGAKISRNNVCTVTISQSEDFEAQQEVKQKLLELYLAQKQPNWGKQFIDACILGPTTEENEDDGELEIQDVTYWDAFSHFCAIFWKVLFACVPPAEWGGGYPSFVASLAMIGIVTYIVGGVAEMLGCAVGFPEACTAITAVALGTSLPDTFASMTAARESDYADSAIGNITGSNSVNVFLGMGIPWIMGSAYWKSTYGKDYVQKPGSLVFSVVVFLCVAFVCILVLLLRRFILGGELGGHTVTKYASGIFLFFLWVVYITLSILQNPRFAVIKA